MQRYIFPILVTISMCAPIGTYAMQMHPACQYLEALEYQSSPYIRVSTRLENHGIDCHAQRTDERITLQERPGGVIIEMLYVEDMLEGHGVKLTSNWEYKTVAIDTSGKQIAAFVHHGEHGFRVYKNGELLLSGLSRNTEEPAIFRFTDDGQLLHSIQGNALYLDDVLISGSESNFQFSRDDNIAHYDESGITYPEESSVHHHNTDTGEQRTIHHLTGEVQFLQKFNNDIYYTLKRNENIYLYKNGELFTTKLLPAPWSFTISPLGDVYFLNEEEAHYTLYKNDQPVLRKQGSAAFLIQGPLGHMWHVGYGFTNQEIHGLQFETTKIEVYRGTESMTTEEISNIEGAFAFWGNQYAVRAAPLKQPQPYFSWPPEWYLLKNGKFIGESFDYSVTHKDFLGLHFAGNNRVYFRNYDQAEERWSFFEDGTRILQDSVEDVLFFTVRGSEVKVYGTKKIQNDE